MGDAERGLGRSPTFLVGTERQRHILDEFQRRDQHLSEQYQKHKPLCFNAQTYQKTHPKKAVNGHKDADAALVSPMMLGVADGVSQIEEFGMDASELPHELLSVCEELAMQQLLPGKAGATGDAYLGPIPLVRDAYEMTEAMGSTTLLLAILDNSTLIHGKLHPMIAVLSIGDCEILILRRADGRNSKLQVVFHTEMQRIDGHCQSPLQVARVDERVDVNFDESIAIEVIERGSAVHCLSAYEGDILVLGSDGVFDNLFLDEMADILNEMLPMPSVGKKPAPLDPVLLQLVARRIVEESHKKTRADTNGRFPETPIGTGGKIDDTCCIIGEVLEWTEAHHEAWEQVQRNRQWQSVFSCGSSFQCPQDQSDDDVDDLDIEPTRSNAPQPKAPRSNVNRNLSKANGGSEEEDDRLCHIM